MLTEKSTAKTLRPIVEKNELFLPVPQPIRKDAADRAGSAANLQDPIEMGSAEPASGHFPIEISGPVFVGVVCL